MTRINFKKYHGLGNSFVIVEDFLERSEYNELAKAMCSQETGIGADGMMVIRNNPLEMIFFNHDGSEAPMCGNGIRAFTQAIVDNGMVTEHNADIITGAGIMKVNWEQNEQFVVEVNMGPANLAASSVPVVSNSENFIEQKVLVDDREFTVTSLFLGTAHSVVFVDDLHDLDVKHYGKLLHESDIFPEKVNVNFAQIKSRDSIDVITFERGVGITYACGTGASSVAYVANHLGLGEEVININLELGSLKIDVSGDDVFMTGPSEYIGSGEFVWRR